MSYRIPLLKVDFLYVLFIILIPIFGIKIGFSANKTTISKKNSKRTFVLNSFLILDNEVKKHFDKNEFNSDKIPFVKKDRPLRKKNPINLSVATLNISDDFSTGGHTGGTPIGTGGWLADWLEINDGAGVPTNGRVRIFSQEIRLRGRNPLTVRAIQRRVDVTNSGDITWTFDWRVLNNNFELPDSLRAQYSIDGGANFITLFEQDGLYLENNDSATEVLTIPSPGVDSIIIQFEYEANGGGEYFYVDDISLQYEVNGVVGMSGNLTCTVGSNEISGTVFEDVDYDGLYGSSDFLGIKGVQIKATDSLDNVLTSETDVNGDYNFTGLTANRTYRIEFILPDSLSWAYSTLVGGDNGTTVQFAKPGNCANLGLSSPSEYCQEDPDVVTICYVQGDYTSPDGGYTDGIVSLAYSASGTSPTYNTEANIGDVGSIYGLAYDRLNTKLFSSSYLKRHSDLGPNGPGAIYVTDLTTSITTLFADLNTLVGAGTAGTDPRPSGFTDFYHDSLAFKSIGRSGLGDIDISIDNKELYVVNMEDGKLYTINSAGINSGMLANSGVTIPNTCGNTIDARPMAVKYYKGKVYVGVTCSAESTISPGDHGTRSDLKGLIYEYDPASNSFGASPVFEFPLDYDRGCVYTSSNIMATPPSCGNNNANFLPWQPDWRVVFNDTLPGNAQNDDFYIEYPQPLISDIEFSFGNMIIGIRDLNGDITGYRTGTPDTADPDSIQGNGMGDVLIACGNPSTGWTMESNGSCGGVTTIGANNLQGPGGGEYYWNDQGPGGTHGDGGSAGHQQTYLGGLAFHQANNHLIVNQMDAFSYYDAGITWVDQATGESVQRARLVGSIDELFGKSNALGDVELLCNSAPLEIGNFVWEDTDGDGVQDAGEMPLPGIRMELYDTNDVLLAFDTTDSYGQYYFSGENIDDATWLTTDDTLQTISDYYIVAGGNQFSSGILALNGLSYALTQDSAAIGTNQYVIDSDGTLASGVNPLFDGIPYVKISTGSGGEVNHTYDFGFIPAYDYGDLPDIADGTTGIRDYETYDSTGGPSHLILAGLFLGDTIDAEVDGVPDTLAVGDDTVDGLDDEDGLIIFPSLNITLGGIIRLPLSVTNTTGDTAYVEAWIDWNGDGDFADINEMVADYKDNEDGVFPEYMEIMIPTDALSGSLVGFRVRLSNTDNMTPYDRINSGEVEDYLLGIECLQAACDFPTAVKNVN